MHSYFCILLLDTYILSHICAALSETESIGDNSRTQTDLSALSLLRSCSGIFLKATSEDIISVASSVSLVSLVPECDVARADIGCSSVLRSNECPTWWPECGVVHANNGMQAAFWCPLNVCPTWWPKCDVAHANNGMQAAFWCPINVCPTWWPKCGVARANNGM